MKKKRVIPMYELMLARMNAGLTQKEVAKILHISPNTVSNHECGTVLITLAQLQLYADLYKVEDYRELCPTPKVIRKYLG